MTKWLDSVLTLGAQILGIETKSMRMRRLQDDEHHLRCVMMIETANSALRATIKAVSPGDDHERRVV